jgi:hypothetical protein
MSIWTLESAEDGDPRKPGAYNFAAQVRLYITVEITLGFFGSRSHFNVNRYARKKVGYRAPAENAS